MGWIVRASIALYGLGLMVSVLPALQGRAAPDELPGAMAQAGLEARGPLLQFAVLLVGVFLISIAGERAIALATTKRWVAGCFVVALASAPVTLMHHGRTRHIVFHGLVAGVVLLARRLEPRFSRADAVLLPALMVIHFAFLDLGFGGPPAATFVRAATAVLLLRLAVGAISTMRRPGVAFAAVPLALLLQMQVMPLRTSAGLALAWSVVTPFLLARREEGSLSKVAACVVYPIAVAAYPLALLGVFTPPHLDFFEDGHSLLPASEMLRGELPYRDIVPAHGLVSDGLLDAVVLGIASDDAGSALKGRRIVGALAVTGIYALTLAATSSADLALLATFLSISLFPESTLWLRIAPALLGLAATVGAIRRRAPGWFVVAGAFVPIAAAFSLEFGAIALVIGGLSAVRARQIRRLLAGMAIILVPVFAAAALLGISSDVLTATWHDVLRAGHVYVIGPLVVPQCLETFASLASFLDQPQCLATVAWIAALIVSAAAIAASPLRARRRDAVATIGLWVTLAGIAWVTRRHYYFAFAVVPFVVAGIVHVPRRGRLVAAALVITVAFFARPFAHVFDVATPLRKSAGSAGKATNPAGISRARGVVLDPRTTVALHSAVHFTSALEPDETFYDFANAAALYYFTKRDCPVRHVEVPLYERESAQREVVEVLRSQPRIRAALLAFPSAVEVDGIANRERAPIIWDYLRKNFEPAFDENGVVFWTRRAKPLS